MNIYAKTRPDVIRNQALHPMCNLLYLPCNNQHKQQKVIVKPKAELLRKKKGGGCMGMTNKQFQGFVRLTLSLIERALQETPDNKELQELKAIFQSMLEDGD